MDKIKTGWIYEQNKDWLDLWTKNRLVGFMDKIKTGWIYGQNKGWLDLWTK